MSLVDGIRDLLNRLSPPRNLNRLSGLFGYTLQALTINQKVKMGVSVGGVPYNVKALDTFNQYDLCAVVGVESTNYLKIVKPFKTRTEIVDLISLITEITNITSIDLVDKITLIDAITSIASIGTIQNIELLKLAYIRNAPRIMNSGFETSDESGWTFSGANVTSTQKFSGIYSAQILSVSGYIEQVLEYPIQCKYIIELSAKGLCLVALPFNTCRFEVTYTDGTTDTHDFNPVLGWINMDMTPHLDTAKTLLTVKLIRQGGANNVFIDNVLVIDTEPRVLTETANIDIVAQTLAQLDIDIKAQSVDLDIKTSGGTNIVIDQLTQSAYLERRSLLSNKGDTAVWIGLTALQRRGKFFPRGCRGYIRNVEIYCKDNGSSGGTITVYITPHPSMGAIASEEITVPASGVATWRAVLFNRMWNYDSLFIFIKSDNTDLQVAYDVATPYDAYLTGNPANPFYYVEYRLWFRTYITGETVGDLNVSGTLNTIEIPHSSDEYIYDNNIALPLAETTLTEIFGSGYVDHLEIWVSAKANSDETVYKVYCDGVIVLWRNFDELNTRGFTASTPRISLLAYTADGFCDVLLTSKFSFLRSLKITMEAIVTADQNVGVEGLVNLIK